MESICAPKRPAPSAWRIIARPTGWSRRSSSTSRCIRPRPGCARRWRCGPIPNGAAPAPLVLDGDGLTLLSLKLDGAPLPPEQLRRDRRPPDHRAAAAAPVPAGDRDAGRSVRQHPAHGPLSLGRDLLHPMRGRRLPPHHLFPRPSRRDGGLHHPHRGRQGRSAGAARQRQSRRVRRPARHEPAFRGLARSVSEAVLSVRAGRRQARPASRIAFAPCRAARSRCASMSSPARRPAAPTRWIRSSAPCAGTRRRSAANTISTSS